MEFSRVSTNTGPYSCSGDNNGGHKIVLVGTLGILIIWSNYCHFRTEVITQAKLYGPNMLFSDYPKKKYVIQSAE